MEARAHVIISGQVQGVFFRREMTSRARYLGVQGWVRNLRDGRVEAVIEGEKSRVEELICYCHTGPPGAKVAEVGVEWSDWKGEFQGFRIAH